MAEQTRVGFYCGKEPYARGLRATVRTDVEGLRAETVLVQFDDPITIAGHGDGLPLNVGWHRFPLMDFDLDFELGEE